MLVFPTSAPRPLPLPDFHAEMEKLATADDVAEAIRAISTLVAEEKAAWA
ncbi:MAG TPA: hypothetical protein VN847_09980 [Streptosporangiaceae bacterium]|jgi:hypothetical protein|nr:hypothetical protein [Streptosporangiaceae bacterium]